MRLEDVEKILAIIDDSHFTEVKLQVGDVQLFARKGGADGAIDAEWVPTPASAEPTAVTPTVHETTAPADATAAASSNAASSTAAASAPAAAPQAEREALLEDGQVVRAPMLGVFYRAPSPGAEPFATEGQEVTAHDTLGSIEVMKLFSSIPAGIDGTLVRFLAENGALVEYNQPLAVVRPHAS